MSEAHTPERKIMYNSLDEFFKAFLPKSARAGRPSYADNDFQRIGAKLAQRALDAIDNPPPDSGQEAQMGR